MKSAYELAMERLEKENPSGPPLTDEQKKALAEADQACDAKIAEKKILAEQEMQSAGNPQVIREIQDRLQEDIRHLEQQRDEKKEAIRKGEA